MSLGYKKRVFIHLPDFSVEVWIKINFDKWNSFSLLPCMKK